ncbi:MAG: glycosyltransferase family 2 protein [Candidatus Lokiarchaeota archaeon]|nr:glycosyltransferase family 2 protein [Candidatus Lokiarchaeota archaeon]
MVQEKPKYIKQDFKLEKQTKKINLISIVIPLYNEENSIQNVINRIPNHHDYEIIVVDDGSSDNSVQNALNSKKKITVIHHKTNKGYGEAILTGLKHASGDIIVTLDSDGQHTPEEIPLLVEPILQNKADVVVGSRYLGKCNFKVPPHTRLGEICINTCLMVLYRQKIGNNQNGFRAFKREALTLFKEMRHTGMGFSTEMLFVCGHNGLRLREIPMTANPREYGTSYVIVNKVLFSILSCLALYAFKFFTMKTGLEKRFNKFLKRMNRKKEKN